MSLVTAQEWADEFLNSQRSKAKQRKAWEVAIDYQNYLATTPDPSTMTGFYAADPKFGVPDVPEGTDPADVKFFRESARRKGEFADAFEQAYTQHRGNIPIQWYMQMGATELRAFGGPEFHDIADFVEQAQHNAAVEREIQQRATEIWELAIEQQDRRTDTLSEWGVKLGDYPSNIDLWEQALNTARGRADLNFEDEIAAYMESERQLFNMMRDGLVVDNVAQQQFELGPMGLRSREREAFTLPSGEVLSQQDFWRFYYNEKSFLEELGHDLRDMSEDDFEEAIVQREALLRHSITQAPDQIEKLITPGLGQGFLEGTFGAIGTVLNGAVQLGGFLVETAGPVIPLALPGVAQTAGEEAYSALRGRSQAELDATIAEIRAQTGRPDQTILAELSNAPAQEAWAQLEVEHPELHLEYVKMAGLDPTLAFAFFQADMLGEVDAKEQLQYITDVRNAETERIEALKEQDFTMGDDIMHLLGAWGRNVPGRLSTMYTIMLTDDDYQAMAKDVFTESSNPVEFFGSALDTWKAVNDASEQVGHMPSAALGIDGSVAGLMLDLGGGIAFDPTTWIFGPRLSTRGVQSATAGQASTLAKSAFVRQSADDIVNFATSPSKGVSAMYHAADWLDEISMGELLNVVDFNPQTMKVTPWRSKPGHHAIEVKRSFLDDILSPDEFKGIKIDELRGLRDDIGKNGFLEPVEISISRADGNVWISDGVKRVLASDDISHLPARLRVTDEVAPHRVVVPGVADDTVKRLQDFAAGKFDNISGNTAARSAGRNEGLAGAIDDIKQIEFDKTETVYVGKIETESGPVQLHRNNQGGNWYFLDPELDGKVVGFLDANDFASGFALKPGRGGRETISQAIDMAQGQGFDLVAKMRLDDLSDAGAATLKHHADNVLSRQLPQGNRFGKHIDDILEEGEELGKPFLEAGENADALMRPDAVLPRRPLLGNIDYDKVYEIMERAIVERGAVPRGAQRSAVARHIGEKIHKLAQANAPGRWLERYMTPQNMSTRFELAGVHSMDKLIDTMYRLWGGNTAKLDVWLEKAMMWQKEKVARSQATALGLAKLQPRMQRLRHYHDMVGDVWDDALKNAAPTADELVQAQANRAAMKKVVADEDNFIRGELTKLDKDAGVLGATDDLDAIILGMWDDYKATYIDTNPAWANRLDDSGTVPWDELKKGSKKKGEAADLTDRGAALPEDLAAIADELDIPAEELLQRLSATQNMKLASQVPVSPLELMLARGYGSASYTRATQGVLGNRVREAAMTFHRLWTIDKVFTVATAATVSFDELLRIFHIGGLPAQMRWFRDRALFMQARAQAIAHGKGVSTRKGAEYLSPKQQERLRVLQDYPTYLKQAERNTFEQHALGWTDILPGEAGYADAARAWTAGFVQDSGFRAFLRGRDSFREWFLSPDGERLRRGTVVGMSDGGARTLIVDAADDFFDGWQAVFDDVILNEAKKAGKYDEVRQAWVDIAERVDASGGLPKDLPDIAINHLGGVRGIKQEMPMRLGVSAMQEKFFDKLFMDPVNYRRGFLADLTRTHEKSRLTSLMHSQGKRIVSDAELEGLLGLQGLAGSSRTGLKQAIQEMALRSGYMPESYIDDLVERAVLNEIENTLYAFDASSRLGAQARVAFPFGKPWADMAGFWGREVVRKPVMRGWVNKTNALGLRTMNEKGLLSFPLVPNRSSALLSRLAHTEFEIDSGLIGGEGEGFLHEGGILPGSESTDFSPLFFLPTDGSNPFSYMIPGLGVVPLWALDLFISNKYDPIEDAEEYEALVDQIGQIVPSVHFQQGGAISRLLGGGTTAKIGGMAVDISGMAGNDSFFNLTSQMGDISREIDRTREISALLADPEELQLLLDAETPEQAEALLQALAVEADKRASQTHLGESLARYMAPASHRFGDALNEIENVWLSAAEFPELAHLLDGDPEFMTDEDRRQVANDIRSAFFRLPDWKRDTMVVQNPALAVNMVGSWEWTPQAINQNIDGTDYAYRTGGSKADLARHQALVDRGYVRPVQPIVRARRILGVIDAARRSAAKELYETQVEIVNDALWQHMPDDQIAMLEWVLDTDFARNLDLETIEEVWFKWNRIEEDFEFWAAEQRGVEPVRGVSTRKADQTDFDRLRASIKIDTEWKPWGVTFPGLDEENVSKRFNEWSVYVVDEKTNALADALGIEVTVGMTGEELFNEAQQIIVQRHHPIYDVVRPDYDRYIQNRSNRSGRNMLYEAAQSELISEDHRQAISDFLFVDQLLGERHSDDPFIPRSDQIDMREKFLFLMNGAKEQRTDWEGIWEEQFERRYGPLDWEPPEPVSPWDEDGNVVDAAFQPYIRNIIDGDTILYQQYKGAPVLHSVRLLGVNTEEIGGPNGELAVEQTKRLSDAILQARENGDKVYLVRDPRFGNTDRYGRMLAWLWIGDKPFYFVEDLMPHRDPSGGDS